MDIGGISICRDFSQRENWNKARPANRFIPYIKDWISQHPKEVMLIVYRYADLVRVLEELYMKQVSIEHMKVTRTNYSIIHNRPCESDHTLLAPCSCVGGFNTVTVPVVTLI